MIRLRTLWFRDPLPERRHDVYVEVVEEIVVTRAACGCEPADVEVKAVELYTNGLQTQEQARALAVKHPRIVQHVLQHGTPA